MTQDFSSPLSKPRRAASAEGCGDSEEAGGIGPLEWVVLDALSAHIALLNEDGVILKTNRAWKSFGQENEIRIQEAPEEVNYLEICESARGASADRAKEVSAGIRSVIRGELKEFVMDYPCHSPKQKRWFYLRARRIEAPGPYRVVISHENITPLKLAEEKLKKREQELEAKSIGLEEANTALKVLLDRRERDRFELEERVLANLRETVLPHVEKLKRTPLKQRDRNLVEILDAQLNDIASPLLQRLAAARLILTPQELQIAIMIKEGRPSKEIAEMLGISPTTVHFHRKNLRKKFGLANSGANIRSYLLSLAE